MGLSNADVDRLWNADVVRNPENPENPTWRASTFLRRYRDSLAEAVVLLREIRDLLRETRQ